MKKKLERKKIARINKLDERRQLEKELKQINEEREQLEKQIVELESDINIQDKTRAKL